MSDEIDPRSPDPPGLAEPPISLLRIEQLIERWWQDHFPGSAVARDTQAWNVAHAAKEVLKRLLKGST
jgi:hypothetical protein